MGLPRAEDRQVSEGIGIPLTLGNGFIQSAHPMRGVVLPGGRRGRLVEVDNVSLTDSIPREV